VDTWSTRWTIWPALLVSPTQALSCFYSETCEIRTPLGQAKGVPNSEVSSFHRAIKTENSSLGPDEVALFHRMSSFRRAAIHRFHCISLSHCLCIDLFLVFLVSPFSI
jgi:hypothetical protein